MPEDPKDERASVEPVKPIAEPVLEVVMAKEPAVATIRLEKKHPLAIRWMHWVNFPVLLLFTMIWR
jgi:hypothetical protein